MCGAYREMYEVHVDRDEWPAVRLFPTTFQPILMCHYHVLVDLYTHSNTMHELTEPDSHQALWIRNDSVK